MKKTLAILLALVMIMSLATVAFAAEETTTGTITITNAAVGETYAVIKLFDASISTTTTEENGETTTTTNVVYTGTIPESLQSVFTTNTSGNIVVAEGKSEEEVIAAVQAWAADQTPAEGNSKKAESTTVTFENLPYGYYAVTTTQGSVVTIDSTTPDASVTDKNTAPTVDKTITGASDIGENGNNAIAQVGETVTYTATITVGSGAKNYVYHDIMENGLSYAGITSIVLDPAAEGEDNKNLTATTDYAVSTNVDHDTESEDNAIHTFDVDFTDTLEATLKTGDTITITYTATVTSDALITDPANNTAYLSYGDAGETTTDTTAVYNATITVTKQDGNAKPLAGAGFVLKNGEGKYYKYTAATETTPAKVEWVDIGETSVADAVEAGTITEYKSDDEGKVTAFAGLTSGSYTLIESTVPDGYNKAGDVTITVTADTYTSDNLSQSATVVNKAGSELPSTGGIGTTLFYIIGGILVVAAAVVLVTKKRMSAEA